MEQVTIVSHPLVRCKLTELRDRSTGPRRFRELARELAILLGCEAFRDLPVQETTVQTPLAEAGGWKLPAGSVGLVPILRAGLGMLDGLLEILPEAEVGHIGLYRDPESLQPVKYYCKLPGGASRRRWVVLDPMLATGGSAIEAVRLLKEAGAKDIRLLCLLAAPEGVEALGQAHPDVGIFTTAVDSHLNDHAYIVPGLGDAGDRLYGTL